MYLVVVLLYQFILNGSSKYWFVLKNKDVLLIIDKKF